MSKDPKIVLPIEFPGAKEGSKAIGDIAESLDSISKILSSFKSFKGLMNKFGSNGLQLGQTLKRMVSDFETLQKGMNANTKSAKAFRDSLKNLGSSVKKVGNEVQKVQKPLEKLKSSLGKRAEIFFEYKSLALMTNAVSSSLNSIVNMQQELANLQAISATTDIGMKSLSESIYTTGLNSKFAVEELAKASVVLAQAGFSSDEIKELLPAVEKLATATGTDLNTSVQTATSVLTVFNLQAENANKIVNMMTEAVNRTKAEIPTLANGIQYAGAALGQMGVSAEEAIAVMSAVTNAGLKARAVVGTGLRALVTELTKPTKALKDQLKNVGLTIEDVDIQSNGLSNVLKTLKDSGFGATEAFKGLERRAASFYLAISSQLDTVDQLRNAFVDSNAAMKAQETQMNTLRSQSSRFGNIMKNLLNNALEPFVKILTALLKGFNDIVSSIGKLTNGFGSIIASVGLVVLTMKNLQKGIISILTLFISLKKAVMGATASVVALDNTMKFIKKTNVWITAITAALTGLFLLYDKFASSDTSKLEKQRGEIDKYKNSIDSLSQAYDELSSKRKLYENDESARFQRIAELNDTFAGTVELKLKGTESFEELAKTMRDAMSEMTKQQAVQLQLANETLRVHAKEIDRYSDPSDFKKDIQGFVKKHNLPETKSGLFDVFVEMPSDTMREIVADLKNDDDLKKSTKAAMLHIIDAASQSVMLMKQISAADLNEKIRDVTEDILGAPDRMAFSKGGIVSKFESSKKRFIDSGMNPKDLLGFKKEMAGYSSDLTALIKILEGNKQYLTETYGDTVKLTTSYQAIEKKTKDLNDALLRVNDAISDELVTDTGKIARDWESTTRSFAKYIGTYDRDTAIGKAQSYLLNMESAYRSYEIAKTEQLRRDYSDGKGGVTALGQAIIEAETNRITGLIEDLKSQVNDKLEALGYIGGDMTAREAASKGVNDWIEDAKRANNIVTNLNQAIGKLSYELTDNLANGFSEAFSSIISGTMSVKESFRQMAISILEDLQKMIVKMLVFKGIEAAVSGFGGSPLPGEEGFTAPVKPKYFATGGIVSGSIKNKDSVPAMLMPGEFVLQKSTVDVLGEGFLHSLNNNALQTLAASSVGGSVSGSSMMTQNIYLIDERSQAQMGPNDVIAVIGKDIKTGGSTRQLIQSVVSKRY